MSYKLTIKAKSHIGESVTSFNEAIYADGISSVQSGVCNPLELNTRSKGKNHVVSVFSAGKSCDETLKSLKELLTKHQSSKLSIRLQYSLKSSLEQMYEKVGGEDGDESLSLIYSDGQNMYAGGYGDVNIYCYNTKTKKAQRITFAGADFQSPAGGQESWEHNESDTIVKTRMPARIKRVSALRPDDEYLILGSNVASLFTEEHIINIFENYAENSVEYILQEAKKSNCKENIAVTHVSVKKTYISQILVTLFIAALLIGGIFACSNLKNDAQDGSDNKAQKTNAVSSNGDEQEKDISDSQIDKDKISSAESEELMSKSDLEAESDSDFDSALTGETELLEGLRAEIDTIAGEVTGGNSNVSYYIKNLETGEVITRGNSKMYSASLIKLYIMAEVYRQVDAGEMVMNDEIKDLLRKMITISDNDACNTLATKIGGGDQTLGFAKITQNAVNLGCEYTVQKNDLQAVREVPIEPGNFTSVKDCGIILEKIYRGELVSAEASAQMLELLKGQQRRFKIPRDLPAGVVVANKTGETSTAQNDVGIVYSEKGDYIICIMISDYANSMDDTMDIIARMSKVTYDYIINNY